MHPAQAKRAARPSTGSDAFLTFLKRLSVIGRTTRTRLGPAEDRRNRDDLLLSEPTPTPARRRDAAAVQNIEAEPVGEKLEAVEEQRLTCEPT
jgi:hypothetical protein